MVSTLFRDPQAWNSALTALRMLQPWAFGSLHHIETMDSASNYYLDLSHFDWQRNVYVYSIHNLQQSSLEYKDHL